MITPFRLKYLTPEMLAHLKTCQYDRLIEKHETGSWLYEIDPPPPPIAPPIPARIAAEYERIRQDLAEFLDIAGRPVLLPVPRSHHQHLTVDRVLVSADEQCLTIFLQDRTPEQEGGFLAICDRVPGEAFYLAFVYHECYYSAHTSQPEEPDRST